MPRIGDEARPGFEIGEVAAFADERLVYEALGDDDMRQGVEDGDIRPGLQGKVIVGLDVRALDQISTAGIDDNETRTRAQTFLQARSQKPDARPSDWRRSRSRHPSCLPT